MYRKITRTGVLYTCRSCGVLLCQPLPFYYPVMFAPNLPRYSRHIFKNVYKKLQKSRVLKQLSSLPYIISDLRVLSSRLCRWRKKRELLIIKTNAFLFSLFVFISKNKCIICIFVHVLNLTVRQPQQLQRIQACCKTLKLVSI